jgi:hypothetical protein
VVSGSRANILDALLEFSDLGEDGILLLFDLDDEFINGIHDSLGFGVFSLESVVFEFSISNFEFFNER